MKTFPSPSGKAPLVETYLYESEPLERVEYEERDTNGSVPEKGRKLQTLSVVWLIRLKNTTNNNVHVACSTRSAY